MSAKLQIANQVAVTGYPLLLFLSAPLRLPLHHAIFLDALGGSWVAR